MRSLVGVINQHIRHAVDNRIAATAARANQFVLLETQRRFVDRTHKNGQEIGADRFSSGLARRHRVPPLFYGVAAGDAPGVAPTIRDRSSRAFWAITEVGSNEIALLRAAVAS